MALLEFTQVSRAYPAGEGSFLALKQIDLAIEAGDSIAIVGASGSGKSTLMNILGCLDRPTGGAYRIAGQDTAALNPDALAALRRERFGFIFQRYNLLPDLSALGNVEVPAIYAGQRREARRARAQGLLTDLGLGSRLRHRPTQLSGGQQQRVSIARALMNGGEIILADEPTGALDSQSGEEVLRLLQGLHAAGHTLILITHDAKVAAHASRIVELRDGEIVSDRRQVSDRASAPPAHTARTGADIPSATPILARTPTDFADAPTDSARLDTPIRSPRPPIIELRSARDRAIEALHMALVAMNAHRLRTFLTMLGIIIGIASLVLVVALGEGGKERVLDSIRSMGTNTIDIVPGRGWGDEHANSIHTLVPQDADALLTQGYIDSVTPSVHTTQTLRAGNIAVSGLVTGVGEQFFRVRGIQVVLGESFNAADIRALAQVVVIDDNTRTRLFGAATNPVGTVLLLGTVPCRIIGVTRDEGLSFGGSTLNVWIPYTTAFGRLLGQQPLSGITIRIADSAPTALAQEAVEKVLTQRHGTKDFYVMNFDTIRQSIEKSVATFTILISSIALISLIVGGIGVMNIMLVSVTERTREIGVRSAVGARQADILRQFLIEAVLVCLFGGALGIALALLLGWVFSSLVPQFSLVFSGNSMAIAVAASTLVGIVFGYLPARNAARLDPIEALARE
jgi:macrolide transport system ATP-binding/permease protein